MSRTRFICIAVVLAVAVAVPAVAASDRPTVGDFLVRVAAGKALPAQSPVVAAESLRASGAQVPSLDFGAPLTQGAVVEISNGLGLALRSSVPEASFSEEQVRRFFSSFGTELGVTDPAVTSDSDNDPAGPYPRPNDNAADPATKGKGKKKGLPVSPSDPI